MIKKYFSEEKQMEFTEGNSSGSSNLINLPSRTKFKIVELLLNRKKLVIESQIYLEVYPPWVYKTGTSFKKLKVVNLLYLKRTSQFLPLNKMV